MSAGSIIIKPKSEGEQEQTRAFETGNVVTIGRKVPADQLSIVLEDKEVSSKHAELRCLSKYWIITDLRSTNGTGLNGQRVSPGLWYRLDSGDRIRIGASELVVSSCPQYEPEEPMDLRECMYNIRGVNDPADTFIISSRLVRI